MSELDSESIYADCVCGLHYDIRFQHSCIAVLKAEIDKLREELHQSEMVQHGYIVMKKGKDK